MHEVIEQAKAYIHGVWHYRWFAIFVAWPLSVIGWGVVYYLPDQYEATARVYVDTESMLRPLLSGLAVQTNLDQQIQMMTRTLLSRPNLEKAVRMADMDLNVKNDREMEALLDRLNKEIQIKGAGGGNLYTISYVNSDAQLAKRVVQSLLTLLVEGTLGDTRKDTNMAQQFLDEQIKEYENRLVEAEEKLKEFKRRNIGLMPAEGQGYYGSLQAAMADVEKADLELHEAENRRDELKRQLGGEEPTFGMVTPSNSSTFGSLSVRKQALQVQLDELLMKYTDNHPDVQGIKDRIKDIEKQEQEKAAARAASGLEPPLEANPVYQQLRVSYGEAEATVASLKVRAREYQHRVDELKHKVNTVPEVEAGLAQLNRDYAVNKQNYESLLARRESAKISQQAEQSADDVKFKVIDPPRVPLVPVAPNRPLLFSIVLVAGAAAGVAFALFMSQINPTFHDRRSLRDVTGLPVLGSVSMVWSSGQLARRRIEIASFVTASMVLLAAYGGVLAFYLLKMRGM